MIPDVGNETAAHTRIREVVEDARRRVEAIVEPATPSASFLASLGDELSAADADPESVPHPQLVDPQEYWDAAIKPQNQSVRRSVSAVLDYAESHIGAHVAAAEAELKVIISEQAAAVSPDDAGARAAVIDDIANHCQQLHHLVAELISVLPSREPLELARQALDEARRLRAVSDVEALKPMYLREAGGDEDHQQFAEQQWSETFADRVSYRDLMLRSEVPWRHQELAVIGHERTRDQFDALVDDVVARMQEPLLDVGARLVRCYDTVDGPAARSS